MSAPSGIRTHTVPVLSRLPLPIGLWGQAGATTNGPLPPQSGVTVEEIVYKAVQDVVFAHYNLGHPTLVVQP